jgi:hypothetical protein
MPTPSPRQPLEPTRGTQYNPSRLARFRALDAFEIRARLTGAMAFLVSFPIIASASRFRELTAPHPLLTGLVGGMLSAALVYFMAARPAAAGAALATAVTFPDGHSTPYEAQFSHEDSLAIRGDVLGALAALERRIAEQPTVASARLKAAELYAGQGADPTRAAQLFREIRGLPGVATRDAIYATSRLVDLYHGPLDDLGRALVELRRIVELYPGTPLAAHARTALPELKARVQRRREERS